MELGASAEDSSFHMQPFQQLFSAPPSETQPPTQSQNRFDKGLPSVLGNLCGLLTVVWKCVPEVSHSMPRALLSGLLGGHTALPQAGCPGISRAKWWISELPAFSQGGRTPSGVSSWHRNGAPWSSSIYADAHGWLQHKFQSPCNKSKTGRRGEQRKQLLPGSLTT